MGDRMTKIIIKDHPDLYVPIRLAQEIVNELRSLGYDAKIESINGRNL